MKRIFGKSELPERTDEGRRLAEDAMAPFLAEFQRAADEETRKSFAPVEEQRALPLDTATCVVTFADGSHVSFEISDMKVESANRVMLAVVGQPTLVKKS